MIIKKLEELAGSERDVQAENWYSRRFLLAEDGMGFSLHDTIIKAGTETYIWYKHHLEAVYCIEGEGEVEEIDTGIVHSIRAGTVYALDGREKHYLRAKVDMRMVCVFSPALTGREVHDEDGIYPAAEEMEAVR